MKVQKPARMRNDTKRAKQKQETRKRILRAAAALFDEKGFFETSPTDIAKEADVAYGSVYAHFDTKGEILTVLHREALEEKFAKISALKRDGRSAIEHLLYFTGQIWQEDTGQTLANSIAFISYVWVHGNQENGLSPQEIYRPFIELVIPLLQEAQQDGDLPADLDIGMGLEISLATYLDTLRQVWFNPAEKDVLFHKLLSNMVHIFRADPAILEKYAD